MMIPTCSDPSFIKIRQHCIVANIHIEHNSSFQGGGGLLQHIPAGGHWRHSRHVHWTQLSQGLGWDGVVLAKISSQNYNEDIKYKKVQNMFRKCPENRSNKLL